MKEKAGQKITFHTVLQALFLTIKYFVKNELLSYASACAFNFLFSVTPIVLMVVAVLVRIVHASPELIQSIFQIIPELQNYIQPEAIIESVSEIAFFGPLEIVLAWFIIWMARRFFASIFVSTRKIFKTQQKRKPIITQILAVVFELLTISCVIAVILAFSFLQALLSLPVFQTIPQLSFLFSGKLFENLLSYLPNFLIFVAVTILFRGASGTNPSMPLCATSAFLCTSSFWLFRIILHSFLNVNRYNLIYGVLSKVIILLMDIYFFFAFFLFFSQYIFVFQFFDNLLLGELYCLSKEKKAGKFSKYYRVIFGKPDFFTADGQNLFTLKKGEFLFKEGQSINCAYFIKKGTLIASNKKTPWKKFYSSGDFIGEVNCIFNQETEIEAKAYSDCEIFSVSKENFSILTEKNSLAAKNVLDQTNFYFSNFFETE